METFKEALIRALMHTDKPSAFFTSLGQAQRAHLRELYDLVGVPQPPNYHPEGDAFAHTMLVIDEAAKRRGDAQRPLDFMLACLVHDLGKKVSTGYKEDGSIHSINHENTGVPLLRAMLGRIGFEEDTLAYCESLCRLHMRVHTCFFGKAGVKATSRLLRECVCPQDLALLAVCDLYGTTRPRDNGQAEEAFIVSRLNRFMESEARRAKEEAL